MATLARSHLRLLFATLALGACSPAMMTPVDGSPSDVADSSATDAAADSALEDAATTCVDVAGSWEWTGSCSDPRIGFPPTTCLVQTGCSVTELVSGQANLFTLSGNRGRRVYTQARDGIDAVETVVYDGDTAMTEFVATAPIRATCMGTGRRGSFAGASKFCCDVSTASCGANQRCVQVQPHSNLDLFATACVPDGTTALGGACMRVMNRAGTDQCQGNAACANFGQPAATSRVCQKLCDTNADCAANEACRLATDAPRSGMCTPRCELLGSSCQAAATCRPVSSLGDGGMERAEPVCDFTGERTEGMACATNFDCGSNLACHTWASPAVCRRVCDDTHACPAGSRCDRNPAGSPTNIGVCQPQ